MLNSYTDILRKHLTEKIPDKNRKIVCFGAGTAGEELIHIIPKCYQIYCLTDNNESLWGKFIGKFPIISPNQLRNINNVFILIVSRHVINIREQLQAYGYVEGIDFADIYSGMEIYFQNKKAIKLLNKYKKFVYTMLSANLEKDAQMNKKIGIAILAEMSIEKMFYQMTLFLILKLKGYNVELIFDAIGTFSDIKYLNGTTAMQIRIMKELIKEVQSIVGDIKYQWLEEAECEITPEDEKMIRQNCHDTEISYLAYLAHREQSPKLSEDEKMQINNQIVIHLKSLKVFLKKNEFSIINVFSGVVDRRRNYTYLGEVLGIRIPTFDCASWSTNGPACWNYDLGKIKLTDKQLKLYSEKGKKLFYERKVNNVGKKGYKQLAKYSPTLGDIKYDVLIPLNLMFDGAVLGLDKVFDTPEQWIYETVKYLCENTDANIMVRESPVGAALERLYYGSYYKLLKEFINTGRVSYSNRSEKVNIYNLIENSKVILPYSSTIGIEAALMNKPVIIHTNCFYNKRKFVNSANSKEEYFDLINYLLEKDNYSVEGKEEAAILFYMLHSSVNRNQTCFREDNLEWLDSSFDEVCTSQIINNVVRVIAENEVWFNEV